MPNVSMVRCPRTSPNPSARASRLKNRQKTQKNNGTGGRTRTGTLLKATDFESVVSTNSTTPARGRETRGRHYSNMQRSDNGQLGIIISFVQTCRPYAAFRL